MDWWQWMVTGAGILGAVKVLWSLVEEAVDVRRAYPVLMEIAAEFKENSGKSLHDRIIVIEHAQSATVQRLDEITRQLEQLLLNP